MKALIRLTCDTLHLLLIFCSVCVSLPLSSQTALYGFSGDFCFSEITLPNLVEAVKHTKSRVNQYLFNYVVSVVLRHRADASQLNIQLPSHICTQPEMYIDMAKVNETAQNQPTTTTTTEHSKLARGTYEVGLRFSSSNKNLKDGRLLS